MSATVAQELAKLRRAYEELLRERDAALAELQARDALRSSEYGEQIAHQAATIDVLKAMSNSPGNPRPVLDMIVQQALILCGSGIAGLFERDGAMLRCDSVAAANMSSEELDAYKRNFPRPLEVETNVTVSILEKRIVHTRDGLAREEIAKSARDLGFQSAIAVPLVKDALAIGAIVLGNHSTGGFTDNQIALLQAFAEQAVIAITSAETYRALHEALEQQTATAEVLQVINASPGDLTPVFDAMLEKAMRLCGAAYGVLRSFDGERMHMLASRGVPPAYAEFLARDTGIVAAGTALMRALQTCRPGQNLDATHSVGYKSGVPSGRAIVDLGGARTILYVPLVKD